MRSVAFKLMAGLAAIALAAVVIVGFFSDRITATEFGNYLEGGVSPEERAADYAGYRYANSGGWPGVTQVLPTLSRWAERRLVITDTAGKVVSDSGSRPPYSQPPGLSANPSLPVIAQGNQVGIIYFLPDSFAPGMMGGQGPGMMGGSGMMGPGASPAMVEMMREMVQLSGSPERRFLDAVNRSLWISGAIAMVVAILLGLLMSRGIIVPLRRIATAAGKVAAGDFSQRVRVTSGDELEALGESFNAMAASLARNEQQRRQLQSDIAHELKTPLSIIQGNLEGMMDGVVEPSAERLASLRDEILLLNRLVNDLRDISVAEAGGLRLHLEFLRLDAIIENAAGGILPQAAERGVVIQTDLPASLPTVRADGHRIAQVLRNLLDNALRYTPAGGTINLTALAPDLSPGELPPTPDSQHPTPDAQRSFVRVTVTDTGKGIPPEDLPHIFDRFYRVDKSRTRASGGTGLGLSVARQLVEAHGGRIWVESRLNYGTSFHFTLPVANPGVDRGPVLAKLPLQLGED